MSESESSGKWNLSSMMLALVIGCQILVGIYIIFLTGNETDLESFSEPAAHNYLIIQTDESGNIMQKWDIEKANFTNRGGSWIFRTEKSRVVLSPMRHFIFLENPTKEERKRFLSVDKE